MKCLLLSVLVFLGPMGTSVAYADSDGYYCVGRGYLAYQFGLAPPPVAPHRLYVLRIGTTPGIAEPVAIELPQFQVHGLACGEGWIDVLSFTAIYHVTLDENARPAHYDVRPFTENEKRPAFPPQRSLGLGTPAVANRKPERVSLGMKRDGGQFFLEMTAQLIPSERYLTVVTSRVVETDRNGRDIRERIIFQGRRNREGEASRVTGRLTSASRLMLG